MNERDGLVSEREVFEFWKIVKDGITLPLLIDLCAKARFACPTEPHEPSTGAPNEDFGATAWCGHRQSGWCL